MKKMIKEYKLIIAHFEYTKSILPYMKNAPIDIKLSLSQRIFDKNNKKIYGPKSPYWT
jgi:hypothetical protein